MTSISDELKDSDGLQVFRQTQLMFDSLEYIVGLRFRKSAKGHECSGTMHLFVGFDFYSIHTSIIQ